jgi:hypothetical protein
MQVLYEFINMSFSEESEFEETISEGIVEQEQDDEFEEAVFELSALTGQQFVDDPISKKRPLETEDEKECSSRKILHTMYGCRHCKSKLGHMEDERTIHKKIDDIFKLMKQTVQR